MYNMELVPMKSGIETNAPTKTVDWRLHRDLLETWYRNIPRMKSAGGSRKKLISEPYPRLTLKKLTRQIR
jgi:hypothetical protein